jgi:hypothetical protein
VPEEAELLRTRRLQEELRRRGAERERARDELDYIDRLLRRFSALPTKPLRSFAGPRTPPRRRLGPLQRHQGLRRHRRT